MCSRRRHQHLPPIVFSRTRARTERTHPHGCLLPSRSSCQTGAPSSCGARDDSGSYTPSGVHAHWDCYDSPALGGEEHGFCGWAWQDHYQCCRNADAAHGDDGFAYVDTVVAYNVRRACAALSDERAAVAGCDALLAAAEARMAAFPAAVWDDELTGRLSSWPKSS